MRPEISANASSKAAAVPIRTGSGTDQCKVATESWPRCPLQAFMCLVAHRHDEVPIPDDVSDLPRAGIAQIEVVAAPDRDCTLVDTIRGIGAG